MQKLAAGTATATLPTRGWDCRRVMLLQVDAALDEDLAEREPRYLQHHCRTWPARSDRRGEGLVVTRSDSGYCRTPTQDGALLGDFHGSHPTGHVHDIDAKLTTAGTGRLRWRECEAFEVPTMRVGVERHQGRDRLGCRSTSTALDNRFACP